jgi:ribonuclease R
MKTNVNVETRSSQRKKFKGVVKGTRQRFGFLNINGHNDIFIKPQEMDRVFSGDIINVTVNDYGTDRQSVSIDEVVDSKFKTCIGVFKEDDTGAYVLPDNYGFNRMIRIPKSYRRGAENGDYVKIEIIEHPFQSKKPKAKVLQVIGKPDSLGVEAEYSIAKKGLSTRLNPAIHEECDNLISNYAKINDGLKRKNLTKLNFITIDGDNTVDIDDAVYVQKLKNKWKLLVAISDVSEFIEENSLIDNEAYNRTSTVYLLGRTIPMLPSELAHEYLSLKEGEKKAVLIADMTLDLDGRLDKYEFYEAFIESKSRFTYNEVDSFIETGRLDDDKLKYKEDIKNLRDLQGLLTEKRKAHSIIPAKRNDYKFLLDENKQIENIEFLSQQTSYKIIEEAMLLANRCAADFISDYDQGIFKAQEGILEAKKKMLSQYLRQHIFFENSMFEDFKDFKHLYKLIENREDSESIKQVLSLNLKKSYYVTEKRKHYVMGFDGYTYFTSPIRRYVDILVHRMIKAKINKKKYAISKPDYISHFTKKEKDIRECSLAVEQWLKANYIAKHSEVEFEAKIISISNFGLHVKIGINGIEGFIPIGDLGDRKDVFKKSDLEMIINKNSFKINDTVNVRLKGVQEEASLIFKML